MPPKLNRLQHIALKVRDLNKSLEFYRDILGFRVIEHLDQEDPAKTTYGYTRRVRFITCTNEHHVVNLTEIAPEFVPPNQPPPENSRSLTHYGLHHFAFIVEGKTEFNEWVDYLKSKEVEFVRGPLLHSPTHPEGDGSPGENRAVYFCDPDGNAIEICCDIMQMGEDDQADPAWHADRLRRDGYNPEEVALPPINR
jgi:catechol 2,3-dioxygenase-like lactoylglutathione lyase family enzyme